MKAAQPPSVTIRQIEFELGMGLPYDAERVMQLRNMLREAHKQAEIVPRAGGETRTAPKLSSALAAFNRRGFFMGHLASGGGPFWRDRCRRFLQDGRHRYRKFLRDECHFSSRMISSGIALLTPAAALRRRNAAAFCASNPNRATLQVSENHSIIALPPTNHCTAT